MPPPKPPHRRSVPKKPPICIPPPPPPGLWAAERFDLRLTAHNTPPPTLPIVDVPLHFQPAAAGLPHQRRSARHPPPPRCPRRLLVLIHPSTNTSPTCYNPELAWYECPSRDPLPSRLGPSLMQRSPLWSKSLVPSCRSTRAAHSPRRPFSANGRAATTCEST